MPVIRATSAEEAVAVLSSVPGSVAVAGGTCVMVDVAEGRIDPDVLVTLRRIDELHGVRTDGTRVRVGAMTTYAELLADPALPLLASASRAVGSPAQRNAGTLGGGLLWGRSGDLATALLALDAELELCGPEGRSTVALETWLHEERTAGELVCAAVYDEPDGSHAYLKAGERQAVISASASTAVVVGADGRVRVAVGGVGGHAVRVRGAEAYASEQYASGRVGDEEVDCFAGLVREGLGWTVHGPRVSASHRRHIAGVLAGRALSRAVSGGSVAA